MSRRILALIRTLVLQGDYVVTEHAWEEALNDDLDLIDIESAILTGAITETRRGDRRGARHVVRGLATDMRRQVAVVLRVRRRRSCVIITVYEVSEA